MLSLVVLAAAAGAGARAIAAAVAAVAMVVATAAAAAEGGAVAEGAAAIVVILLLSSGRSTSGGSSLRSRLSRRTAILMQQMCHVPYMFRFPLLSPWHTAICIGPVSPHGISGGEQANLAHSLRFRKTYRKIHFGTIRNPRIAQVGIPCMDC